ncbi:bifunctional metallophosphatase/5'-nucleotidase [Gemella sp. 19428wG2_WT2a]|nr:bifunctional metallophosphatase/5'-nucleotidase [Gemella sp. 19428wG2_WT2a]TFU59530.1 bifunctional metallophosphatase/5'-nucleotidase [Gemella sp. WT2a]
MKNKKLIQAGSLASLTLLAALASSTEARANEVAPSKSATSTPVTSETLKSVEASPISPAPTSVETSLTSPAPTSVETPSTSPAPAEKNTSTSLSSTESTNVAIPVKTTTPTESKTKEKEVVILHTNDIHGRLEEETNRNKTETTVVGLAKLDTIVKEEKSKDKQSTYLLDAGDAFQGLPISNASKGEDMANIMNKIGYDAMAVGNHEFDFSLETAKKYKEILKFPILSANTYANDVRLFEAHTILDKDKDAVGDELVVIGVTTPETATKTHPRNVQGVVFKDPITEVENIVKELVAKVPYKNYVVLAHLGNDASTLEAWRGSTLAKALSTNPLLKDKNVIVIDGHSHTIENAKFGNVSYTQTGSYLNNVGKVSFTAGSTTSNIALIPAKDATSLTANTEIANLVKSAKENFEKINSAVVIENNPVELSSARENVRVRETNLGNLVSDALYSYGNKGGFEQATDLAVFNGGGIRADIKKDSKVTKADIIKVLPFGNSVAQIEVTGQAIKDMFNVSLASTTQKNKETGELIKDENGQPLLEALGGFLHISGAKVYYDTNLEKENRILNIEILNQNTGLYEKLDLNKTYRLATNDFLAAGGDGYTMLGGARKEGPSVDEALAQFIKTANLSDYSVVNPNSRLISISSEEFAKLNSNISQPTVKPTEKTDGKAISPLTPSDKTKTETISPLTQAEKNMSQAVSSSHPTSSADKIKLTKDSQNSVSSKSKLNSTKTDKKLSTETNKKAKVLPKTSSSNASNSALPAELAAILLAAGLLTIKNKKAE